MLILTHPLQKERNTLFHTSFFTIGGEVRAAMQSKWHSERQLPAVAKIADLAGIAAA
jgi:hypothetical protein